MRAGIGCKLSKWDMSLAFRHLRIKLEHWCLLIMKAESPVDGKTYYFIDKCFPFGASISCSHFQRFSNGVVHIVVFKTECDVINYLDDFLFVALLRAWCDNQVQVFLDICRDIQFPVALQKTFWSTTKLVFLRLLIDSENQIVAIPLEKIQKALQLIEEMLQKKKVTLKQLQKMCGFLNFLGRVVVLGSVFTQRLYMSTKGYENMKPHHHIKLKPEVKKDLIMWKEFLNCPEAYSRLFSDFSVGLMVDEMGMFSDASKSPKLGFGGLGENSWVFAQCPPLFIKECDPSIEYLELYMVTIVLLNWLHCYRNRRVVMFCDNQAVVSMVNNNMSSCANCLVLIRIIVMNSLKLNSRVFATYISSGRNKDADLLLQLRVQQFKNRNPHCDEIMTPIPEIVRSIEKVWLK